MLAQSPNNKWWWFAGGVVAGVGVTYAAYRGFSE